MAFDQDVPLLEMSSLCSRCHGLILDDETIFQSGVVEKLWEDGTALLFRCLDLGLGDGYVSSTFRPSAVSRTSHEKEQFFEHIPLKYSRSDRFPNFPELTKSSNGGCTFCRLLLEQIKLKLGTVSLNPRSSFPSSRDKDDSLGQFDNMKDALGDTALKREQVPNGTSSATSSGDSRAGSWADFAENETVQISFAYFLKQYQHQDSPWATNVTHTPWDKVGLARLSAKVSKRGQHNMLYKSSCLDGEDLSELDEDPFDFSETHINFSVKIDNEFTKVGKYLQIYEFPIESFAFSATNRARIQTWLRQCQRSDDDVCGSNAPRRHHNKHTAPTRLLNVGEPGNFDGIFLQVPAESLYINDDSFEYVALSYRWGGKLPLTTTSETLTQWKANILFERLPPLFQDAVSVTWLLGKKYLWIDALCIIQGDTDDWCRESAKMSNLFTDAFCTIAATASNSPEDYFLRYRIVSAPSQCLRLPFQSTRNPDVQGTYIMEPQPNPQNHILQEIESSPWADRGWTFQEQQLSRRLLVFGKQRVHFHCNSYSLRENCLVSFRRQLPQTLVFHPPQGDECMRPRHQYQQWYSAVEEYSQRKLTYFHDRLPSVQGIAQAMHRGLQLRDIDDTYVAGLWRSDLLVGLAWKAVPGQASEEQGGSHRYVAPTWSWASYNGPVVFDMACFEQYRFCWVEDCSIVRDPGADAFGLVSGASLTAKGLVYRCESPSQFDISTMCKGTVEHSGHTTFRSVVRFKPGVYLDGEKRYSGSLRSRDKKFGLLVLFSDYSFDRKTMYYGLVLQVAEVEGEDTWVRVGVFVSDGIDIGKCDNPGVYLESQGWTSETLILV